MRHKIVVNFEYRDQHLSVHSINIFQIFLSRQSNKNLKIFSKDINNHKIFLISANYGVA